MMNSTRWFQHFKMCFLVALTLIGNSCAHQETKQFSAAIHDGDCDRALESIQDIDPRTRFLGRVNRASGTVLSYAATGAGYTADIAITVVGGAVIMVALCAPMAMAQQAAVRSGGSAGVELSCLPSDISKINRPKMGKEIYKATGEMRCPDLTVISRSVRQVASCYEAKGGSENLQKAKTSLNSTYYNEEFRSCLTEEERAELGGALNRIEGQISRLNSQSH